MVDGRIAEAEGLLREALTALRAATGDLAADDDLIDGLRVGAVLERELQLYTVDTVAGLQRRAVFTRRGQRAETALTDLLGMEHPDARRVVIAAEQARPRTDLQGQVLAPRLPATAAALQAGTASLRHVEVLAGLMASPTAQRLSPQVWAGAEAQIAALAGDYTPTKLRTWGQDLLGLLDQDGAEPDEREPGETNEFFLTRDRRGQGGTVKGRFEDAAMFDILAAMIGAKAAPLTKDDTRPLGQRQAEALAEILGWVADHGDTTVTPAAGGRRPHLNVLIRLEDLQARARAALLDFGATMTPGALRWLCCDACVIPIVMDGAGQPLDVGRKARTIPDGLRRAVAARDRGCAHPGCSRPPSWSEVHHVHPWELGGETKLSNLVMLCSTHHREIHTSGWSVRIAPDGLPEFYPPAWIDPLQKPRRNPNPYRPDTG